MLRLPPLRFRFNKTYLFVTLVLFIVEVLIALYLKDRIVRPYGGDFLVVILLYACLKSFVDIPVITAALVVLGFAYGIELLQYYRLVHRLGIQGNPWLRVIIGTDFEWLDVLAYTLGILTVLGWELHKKLFPWGK